MLGWPGMPSRNRGKTKWIRLGYEGMIGTGNDSVMAAAGSEGHGKGALTLDHAGGVNGHSGPLGDMLPASTLRAKGGRGGSEGEEIAFLAL